MKIQTEKITWMSVEDGNRPDVDTTVLIYTEEGDLSFGSWDDEHNTWWDYDGEPVEAVYWAIISGPEES